MRTSQHVAHAQPAPTHSVGLAPRGRNKHPAVTEQKHRLFFPSEQPHLASPELTLHISFCPACQKLTQECRNLLIRFLCWKETELYPLLFSFIMAGHFSGENSNWV